MFNEMCAFYMDVCICISAIDISWCACVCWKGDIENTLMLCPLRPFKTPSSSFIVSHFVWHHFLLFLCSQRNVARCLSFDKNPVEKAVNSKPNQIKLVENDARASPKKPPSFFPKIAHIFYIHHTKQQKNCHRNYTYLYKVCKLI